VTFTVRVVPPYPVTDRVGVPVSGFHALPDERV
jgi:hypothetical protein